MRPLRTLTGMCTLSRSQATPWSSWYRPTESAIRATNVSLRLTPAARLASLRARSGIVRWSSRSSVDRPVMSVLCGVRWGHTTFVIDVSVATLWRTAARGPRRTARHDDRARCAHRRGRDQRVRGSPSASPWSMTKRSTGFGSRSVKAASMRTRPMPSAIAWCTLMTTAALPSCRPVSRPSRHSGRLRSNGSRTHCSAKASASVIVARPPSEWVEKWSSMWMSGTSTQRGRGRAASTRWCSRSIDVIIRIALSRMRSGVGSASSSQIAMIVDCRSGSCSMCQMIASDAFIIERYFTAGMTSPSARAARVLSSRSTRPARRADAPRSSRCTACRRSSRDPGR